MSLLEQFSLVPHTCKTVSVSDRFGRLSVLATGKPLGTYRYKAVCQCDCGSPPVAVRVDALRKGATISCGCVQRERSTTHGLTKHPLYHVWSGLKRRCQNPTDVAYPDYGGRGIQVCQRWGHLPNFVADMYPTYVPGLEIDRRDNDGHYTPENCRWADHITQSNNRRGLRLITYNNKTQTLKRWSSELNLKYKMLWTRIVIKGWTIQRAFTTQSIGTHERMALARAASAANRGLISPIKPR